MNLSTLAQSAPHYSGAIYRMIMYCSDGPKELGDIIQTVSKYSEFSVSVNSPQEVLEWVIDAGGIAPESDEGELYVATDEGLAFLTEYNPLHLIEQLFAQEAEYKDVLRDMLDVCSTPQGMSALEKRYESHPQLVGKLLTPNYFISELERTGAVIWDGGWRTTDAGKRFLQR